MTAEFLTAPSGRRLAYHRQAGQGPGILFLGGFASDMTGTKAQHLAAWAADRGRAFLRFDYSGHGASSGRFEDGCISDWAEDALAVLDTLTSGPQVLIGSSMGGWISLLLARFRPERLAGLIGIAAAPDFTEDSLLPGLSAQERAELAEKGAVTRTSSYGGNSIFTARLFEDGRRNLVLRGPLDLPFPTRLLQGSADAEVPPATALRLFDHARGPDIRLTLVKGADHRFSTPDCLDLITATAEALCQQVSHARA